MLANICEMLLELHRDRCKQAINDFPAWAMGLVRGVIPHDACFWGSGAFVNGEVVVHSAWFNNIPAESMQTWEQHKHADTFAACLLANGGKALNFVHAELCRNPLYGVVYSKVGVEQLLGIYYPDQETGLYDAISLYRSDPGSPFSEEERQLLESMTPHLIEVQRANYLDGWTNGSGGAQKKQPVAVADRKGVLRAANQDFMHAARTEWPNWRGAALPEFLQRMLQKESAQFLGDHVVIHHVCVNDKVILSIRPRSPVDSLTRREREISLQFANGASHKVIAAKCKISPATVRNHLGTIYRKLNVASKTELAQLFSEIE